MFKQIAYPFSAALAASPSLPVSAQALPISASPTRSRAFPWLWVLLLTGVGLLVWWLIRQGPTGRASLWADLTGRTPTLVVSSQSVPDQPAPVAAAIQQAHAHPGSNHRVVSSEAGTPTIGVPASVPLSGHAVALADQA
ncbi:hypothetical protein [Spirosoma pomorum]